MPTLSEFDGEKVRIGLDREKLDLVGLYAQLAHVDSYEGGHWKYLAWPHLMVLCSDRKLHTTHFENLLRMNEVSDLPSSAGEVGWLTGHLNLLRMHGYSSSLQTNGLLLPMTSTVYRWQVLYPLLGEYIVIDN